MDDEDAQLDAAWRQQIDICRHTGIPIIDHDDAAECPRCGRSRSPHPEIVCIDCMMEMLADAEADHV